jgi:hypothetical protein
VSQRTGEHQQVGSTCLHDFLGGANPTRARRHAEQFATLAIRLADLQASASAPVEAVLESVGVQVWAAHAAHTIRTHG